MAYFTRREGTYKRAGARTTQQAERGRFEGDPGSTNSYSSTPREARASGGVAPSTTSNPYANAASRRMSAPPSRPSAPSTSHYVPGSRGEGFLNPSPRSSRPSVTSAPASSSTSPTPTPQRSPQPRPQMPQLPPVMPPAPVGPPMGMPQPPMAPPMGPTPMQPGMQPDIQQLLQMIMMLRSRQNGL